MGKNLRDWWQWGCCQRMYKLYSSENECGGYPRCCPHWGPEGCRGPQSPPAGVGGSPEQPVAWTPVRSPRRAGAHSGWSHRGCAPAGGSKIPLYENVVLGLFSAREGPCAPEGRLIQAPTPPRHTPSPRPGRRACWHPVRGSLLHPYDASCGGLLGDSECTARRRLQRETGVDLKFVGLSILASRPIAIFDTHSDSGRAPSALRTAFATTI